MSIHQSRKKYLRSKLEFEIKLHGSCYVIIFKDNGMRPATNEEVLMWNELLKEAE